MAKNRRDEGDRNEHLPTAHGFDEFLGNLYHLNAEVEPENEDCPRDMVLANGKPFFVWWNGTRMHFRTHVDANKRHPGNDEYTDGMIEHDGHVGELLNLLDELGIADNTIVTYSTDNGRKYRNHIDGYNMLDYLSGKTDSSPRHEFWYVNDDGQILAARYDDWKVVFLENRGEAFGVWREPFVELRVPLLFNLRRDPFEKSQHYANTYDDWFLDRPFIIVPIQGLAARFLLSMKEYPPSQSPGSFNLSKIETQINGMIGSN